LLLSSYIIIIITIACQKDKEKSWLLSQLQQLSPFFPFIIIAVILVLQRSTQRELGTMILQR
jgi:hypothetical protein